MMMTACDLGAVTKPWEISRKVRNILFSIKEFSMSSNPFIIFLINPLVACSVKCQKMVENVSIYVV